jgi:hypothetical protein
MKKTNTTCATVLAALACAGSLHAHHSGSMYATTPIWIKGTVVRFELIDPHTITTLEDRSEDGQVRRWAVEGPAEFQLDRLGLRMDVPEVGDIIEFCAFPYKSAAELSRLFPGVDFSVMRTSPVAEDSSPQSVAGHIMVMPNGEKRLWEPHGLISECIRSSDEQRQPWLDFLDSNAGARQAWCEQKGRAHVQSTASLKGLFDEIDGLIGDPCE